MSTAIAELAMNATPDAVWELVGDFYGIGGWMPGIETCEADGADRLIGMMGMTIREHLVNLDDAGKVLTYSITDGAPVESHEATITVHDADTGCRVTWDVTATPDDMANLMQGLYQQALEALKTKVETA